jgi:hypothetical protein
MIDKSKLIPNIVGGHFKTAGEIKFLKDSGPLRRDVRVTGFKWSAEALKELARVLWASQRSHSYSLAALRMFSKMSSAEFSPDGLLGGRGYIQAIKDIREGLSKSSEILSAITDTLHDEINADHWKISSEVPAESEALEEVETLMHDTQDIQANPEGFVEEQLEQEIIENPSHEGMNPEPMNPVINNEEEEEEKESTLVQASDKPHGFIKLMRRINGFYPHYNNIISKHLRVASNSVAKIADSSIPVSTLPGPRITRVGPGDGSNPNSGGYNPPEDDPSDDPSYDGFNTDDTNVFDYLYESEWSDGATAYASSHVAETYSWLPGSKNEKNLDYYNRNKSSEDIEYMKEHNQPDAPADYPKKLDRPYEKT